MMDALFAAVAFLLVVAFLWGRKVFIRPTKFTPAVDIGDAFWQGGWGAVIIWRDGAGFVIGYDRKIGWRAASL